MCKGIEDSESYGEVYDKITRVVKYMTERDGKEPDFQEFFLEIVKSRDLPTSNLEFIIPRYAEVWQTIVGYVDFKPLLELIKVQNLKTTSKKTKSVLKSLKNFNANQRFLPVIDKNKTKTIFLLISLFILICFYYEWFTNIIHHVDLFFGVKDDSFLGFLALFFWGAICLTSGLYVGYEILKSLYKTSNPLKNKKPNQQEVFGNIEKVFLSNKIMIGLFVVFFLFFSSSSNYFNNYIGLKLQEISEEEYTISGDEYLEYNERGRDVPDDIVYEILDKFDNNLFQKEKVGHIKKRLDVFNRYYEYIGFNSEKFIFKETGAFQGYSTFTLKEGFFSYLKCLFFSFLETFYRGIVFFSISGIIILPLLLLSSKCSDEQLRMLMNYGGSVLVIVPILYLIYLFGETVFEWVKSFFN